MPTKADESGAVRRFGLFVVISIFLLLFGFGSTSASGGLVAAPWDKIIHFAVFASLTIGLRITMPKLSPLLIGALALSIGLADELHQYFVPNRQPDLDDWLADLAGSIGGLLAWRWLQHQPFVCGQSLP